MYQVRAKVGSIGRREARSESIDFEITPVIPCGCFGVMQAAAMVEMVEVARIDIDAGPVARVSAPILRTRVAGSVGVGRGGTRSALPAATALNRILRMK
jgi:hypothetical protein